MCERVVFATGGLWLYVSTLLEILVDKIVPDDTCGYWAVSTLLEILELVFLVLAGF